VGEEPNHTTTRTLALYKSFNTFVVGGGGGGAGGGTVWSQVVHNDAKLTVEGGGG
jgi:hypothetical protein